MKITKKKFYVQTMNSSEKKKCNSPVEVLDNEGKNVNMNKWDQFCDYFKRNDAEDLGIDPNLTAIKKATIATENSQLSKTLNNRHLQKIVIWGAIGTGLFVGPASKLTKDDLLVYY